MDINKNFFIKMAHGDPTGLKNLAFDFFNDTRRLMTGWSALIAAGNYGRLRDELHRCKGGASLFGLERLVAMISKVEKPLEIELQGFDLDSFEQALSQAEMDVKSMAEELEFA